MLSRIPENENGDSGDIYGTPKLFLPHIFTSTAQNSRVIPHSPPTPPAMINEILRTATAG